MLENRDLKGESWYFGFLNSNGRELVQRNFIILEYQNKG